MKRNSLTAIPTALLIAAIWLAFSASSSSNTSQKVRFPKRSFRFQYQVVVRNLSRAAQRLDLWIPVPRSGAFQRVWDLEIDSPVPYRIVSDPEYGNRMAYIHAEGRLPERIVVTLRFKATRQAYSAWAEFELPRATPAELERFLQPDSLVPVSGKIAEEAKAVAGGIRGTRDKAKALYDHLVETMEYDKSGQGWGRGDALYACDARRGNCTDFHSLFIGMARSLGIPARFVIGFPLPENVQQGPISGYHCWAEFYLDGKGWVPVDASEARKHPEKRRFLFGGLDANRIAFTVGRDIRLVPPVTSKRLNYFVYPFVLVDGREYPEVETHLRFSELQPQEAGAR